MDRCAVCITAIPERCPHCQGRVYDREIDGDITCLLCGESIHVHTRRDSIGKLIQQVRADIPDPKNPKNAGRPVLDVRDDILAELRASDEPLSVQAIASSTRHGRAQTQNAIDVLAAQGLVEPVHGWRGARWRLVA